MDSQEQWRSVPVVSHTCQVLVLSVIWILDILKSVLWYFIFVLTHISRMTHDVKHLSISLFVIWIPSLVRWLGRCGSLFLFCWVLRGFIYFGQISFIRAVLCKYFLPVYGLLFHSLDRVFHIPQVFYFNKVQLIFSFMDYASGAFLLKCVIWIGRKNSNLGVEKSGKLPQMEGQS